LAIPDGLRVASETERTCPSFVLVGFGESYLSGWIEKRNSLQMLARVFFVCLVVVTVVADAGAQKKRAASQAKPKATQPASEVDKLRKDYIETTKQYKASLEKLLPLYQAGVKKAEDRFTKSKELFKLGLISKSELDDSEQAVTLAQAKVAEVQQQTISANTQIAQTLIEIDGEKQIAKLGPVTKGGFVRTTSFIRYGGAAAWSLSQAGAIQSFFQQTFKRPLPIAVFGQGAIHNQWRLDHHNAMDVSVYPDTPEGLALMEFLRSHGIPFSAFRIAIPGVATGPHIHIGLPSHRY